VGLFFLDQCICLFNKPVYLIIRLSSTERYYINTVYMFYASFCLFSFAQYRKLGILASGYFGGFLLFKQTSCEIPVVFVFKFLIYDNKKKKKKHWSRAFIKHTKIKHPHFDRKPPKYPDTKISQFTVFDYFHASERRTS
jgi:hypothetical protein